MCKILKRHCTISHFARLGVGLSIQKKDTCGRKLLSLHHYWDSNANSFNVIMDGNFVGQELLSLWVFGIRQLTY